MNNTMSDAMNNTPQEPPAETPPGENPQALMELLGKKSAGGKKQGGQSPMMVPPSNIPGK